MVKAQLLQQPPKNVIKAPVIGVCTPADPRVNATVRERVKNIIAQVAQEIARGVKLPGGEPVSVVYSDILIDGEAQADAVARQFLDAGVNIIVMCPDTWAYPQLSAMSLLAHFPKETPVNITCGNSAPFPGVVFAHALSGALSQSGKLVHLNVGTWPDSGQNPKMTPATANALCEWCQAAVTAVGLRGRRVLVFGHDSMGMETALSHIIPTRNTFGLEIARLDMKLLADLLNKGAYNKSELKDMRAWVDKGFGKRLILKDKKAGENFDMGLAAYLVIRDLMREMNCVGGGFMNQLEWGSDKRGLPLPVMDIAESLFNSTFDHNGRKEPLPYATEADTQGLLTMLVFTWLSGGQPPLFMDFRKVWEPWELKQLANKLKLKVDQKALWAKRGFVDGDNSGSASFDWAGKPGWKPEQILKNIALPPVEDFYFPGGGNSVTFVTPGGIEGIAGRMCFSGLNNTFGMIWDEACTIDLPQKMAEAVANSSNVTWPHTWVCPKYASMAEYKQYAPANHFHMTWNLKPAVLQYWMDLTNVLSITPWKDRPSFIEGVDRPQPLIHLINGGENAAKQLLR